MAAALNRKIPRCACGLLGMTGVVVKNGRRTQPTAVPGKPLHRLGRHYSIPAARENVVFIWVLMRRAFYQNAPCHQSGDGQSLERNPDSFFVGVKSRDLIDHDSCL